MACVIFFKLSSLYLNDVVCSWPAVCIHGDKSQQERDWVLQGTCVNISMVNHCNRYFRLQILGLVKLPYWWQLTWRLVV